MSKSNGGKISSDSGEVLVSKSLLRRAKKMFGRDFGWKVSSFGCTLSCGITKMNGSFGISARVHSKNPLSEEVKKQIQKIFSEKYPFEGHFLLVVLNFDSRRVAKQN